MFTVRIKRESPRQFFQGCHNVDFTIISLACPDSIFCDTEQMLIDCGSYKYVICYVWSLPESSVL